MRYLQMTNIPEISAVRLLRKGQRWDMAEQQMRIYRVGVHLVEFRMFKVSGGVAQHKLGRSSLETVGCVQDYLTKHEAVLGKE